MTALEALFSRFLDDSVQGSEDPVAVLGFEHVLELVEDQQHRRASVRGEAERQPQDGLHVLLIQVPAAGKDLVGIGEGLLVKDEVGTAQIILDEAGVLRRCRGYHPDDGGAVAGEELVHGADVQDGELAHREGPLAVAHGIHRLLDEGGFPGLGRLVENHMLVLGDQVRKDRALGFPADEILAGHEFVIREWGVHRPAGNYLVTNIGNLMGNRGGRNKKSLFFPSECLNLCKKRFFLCVSS